MVAVNRKASQVATVITDLADDDFWLGVRGAGLEDARMTSAAVERYIRNKLLADPIEGVLTVPATYVEGTDATALLQGIALAARALGRPWRLRAGVTYTVLGEVITWTDLDLGGCEILTTNAGQDFGVLRVDTAPGDLETVSLATANAWTLSKGAGRIPELAGQRGWTYVIDSAAPDIGRAGGDSIGQGQTFTVISDDGQISRPLCVAFTTPFANASITRKRMRGPVTVSNGTIRVTSSSGASGRARLFTVSRPNTVIEDVFLVNDTELEAKQGFVHEKCERVTYVNSTPNGMHSVATNYGWNGNLATDVTFLNCNGAGCRRDIDAHRCCDYRIIGGNFPDGVGGHWLHGLYLSGMPTIGVANSVNAHNIHMSGSDIIGAANFLIDSPATHCVGVRGDLLELSGTVDLSGSIFTLDNTNDQIGAGLGAGRTFELLALNQVNGGSYDALRPVELPSTIDMTDITINVVGTLTFQIIILALGVGAGGFTQPITYAGLARVRPKAPSVPMNVPSGPIAGSASLRVNYTVTDSATGAGYDIDVDGIKRPQLWMGGKASPTPGPARARVTVHNADDGVYTLRYGAVQSFRKFRSKAPTGGYDFTSEGSVPVGDEIYRMVAEKRPQSLNLGGTRFHWPNGHAPSTTQTAVEANKLYGMYCDKTVKISALDIVIAAGAAGACRAGIYCASDNGRPLSLFREAAELLDTSTPGTKEMAFGESLFMEGAYWLVLLFSGTPTIYWSDANRWICQDVYGFNSFNSASYNCMLSVAQAYGPLPFGMPAMSPVTGTSAPLIGMKVG